MKRCPITYQALSENEAYSPEGLKKIDRRLKNLKPFPYTAEDQRKEARIRAGKISIQGMQPKLSAKVNVKNELFEVTNEGGRFILKPQTLDYAQLPENEDVTMKLAEYVGIEVPLHGLIWCRDETLIYFIKRIDREGRKGKIPLEDFAQLSGQTRDTKYDSSLENVAWVIETHCSIPLIEKEKLFVRTLFNYLVGNEDVHLKNFSLIVQDSFVALSPAYDLVNTTIALDNPKEESALPLNGKKSKLTVKDLLIYFPLERLKLNQKIVDQTVKKFQNAFGPWETLIGVCLLDFSLKEKYLRLISDRRKGLGL